MRTILTQIFIAAQHQFRDSNHLHRTKIILVETDNCRKLKLDLSFGC